jgi:hypothetical protein
MPEKHQFLQAITVLPSGYPSIIIQKQQQMMFQLLADKKN